jgi:Domain of unknown function (DUF4430)
MKFLACLKKSKCPLCNPSNKRVLLTILEMIGETGSIPVQCRYGKSRTPKRWREQVRIPIILTIPSRILWNLNSARNRIFFMGKNRKTKIIIPILILSAFLGGLVFYYKIQQGKNSSTLSVLSYQYKAEAPESVYDFMQKLQNESKIAFQEKTYAGMGKFIESINGIKNSGDKNWIYYVNGEKANIGVSNYKINIGDIVSWKYEKSY